VYSRRSLTPRLACIRPAASVHPEPGSNSSLYKVFLKILYFQDILTAFPKGPVKLINRDVLVLFSFPCSCASLCLWTFPFYRNLFSCLFPSKRDGKSNTLFYSGKLFWKKIFSLFLSSLFPSKDISYPLTPASHPLYELPRELGVQKYISFLFKQVFPISFFEKNVIYFLNIWFPNLIF
jgi:hypothetical protein